MFKDPAGLLHAVAKSLCECLLQAWVHMCEPWSKALCANRRHLVGLGVKRCGWAAAILLLQVCTAEPRGKAFRHFLDGSQYQVTGILRYEKIFGEGYVSTGGAETTKVGT